MIIPAKIGPTFSSEMNAAKLSDGVFWTPESVIVSDALTADTVAAIEAVIAAHDPTKQLPPPPVSIDKIAIWRRMTDAEHDAMVQGVAAQSQRIQDIFNATVTFRADAPEWPLLQQMATQLYGSARAAELLAPIS